MAQINILIFQYFVDSYLWRSCHISKKSNVRNLLGLFCAMHPIRLSRSNFESKLREMMPWIAKNKLVDKARN